MEDVTWEGERLIEETGPELLVGKQFLVGVTVMSPTS
jgi:hypothetical protein